MIMPDPILVRRWRESDFKLFHTLPIARNGHCLTPGYLQLSINVSKEFISHVIRKFKLIWANGSEHNLKSSTAMGLNVQHWGVVSNEWETMWKREVQKQSMHSELYFVLFHFKTLSR
jgi:hypothetical protein